MPCNVPGCKPNKPLPAKPGSKIGPSSSTHVLSHELVHAITQSTKKK
jgi:hypothetical protein